jgi:hypothetical protein
MNQRWGNAKIAVLLLMLFIAFGSVNALGIGISTQTVFFKNILRGGYAEGIITASNPNGYDMAIEVALDGDVAPWITLEPQPPNIIIPARSNGEFKVVIQPPPFIQNGVYNGSVIVLTGTPTGKNSAGAGSAIISGAAVDILVEISDTQNKSLTLRRLVADPSEECGPIVFRLSTKNSGNVELAPSYNVKLYTSDKSQLLKEGSNSFGLIKPTVTRTDYVVLDSKLDQLHCIPTGNYVAEVSGSTDGDTFYTGSSPVQIVDKGTLSIQGIFVGMTHLPQAFVGEPLKIIGKFNNTGGVTEEAQLKVEAYKGDRLVSVVTGDKVRAEPDSITSLPAFFVPSEIGQYRLVGSVSFGGKASDTVETALLVQYGMTMMIIFASIPVIIVAIVTFIIYKRKQRGY